MFELDEAIADSELLSIYANDFEGLECTLDRITQGLSPLNKKYEVVYQFYPTWQYREVGYGKNPKEPLNRVSDVMKYALSYFEERGLGVYLEMHSSGIRTAQNGELGNLSPAPLHYGDREKRKCLPMDMEALAALKQAFPKALRGVRFHELVGSHEIGLHDRACGREEQSHAFVVSDEVIRGIIDTCKIAGLELVWSDHMFNDVVDRSELFACFKTWIDYAIDTLGSDRVTLNWANNGWPMHKYIVDTFRFKNYRGAHIGMSVQSWFWQELDSSTMVTDTGSGFDVKWHSYAEMDCPIELMAIFTKKYLDDGCRIIQFEPPHYFFNYYRPSKTVVKYGGCVEKRADYSLREHTKRFIDMLLNPETMAHLSTNLTDYYDADRQRFVLNSEKHPAKRYAQSTLFLKEGDGKLRVFDWIGKDVAAVENSAHRLHDSVLAENVICACRAHMGYSPIDDFLVVKNIAGSIIGEFYNVRSGRILCDRETFADNQNGRVVAAAGINLDSKYLDCFDGDGDEIVTVRKNKCGKFTVEVFRAVSLSNSLLRKFRLEKMDSPFIHDVVQRLGDAEILSVACPRITNSVLKNGTRPVENNMVFLVRKDGKTRLVGVYNGRDIDIEVCACNLKMAALDVNGDTIEEIALVSDEKIGFFDLTTMKKIGEEITGVNSAATVFATRISGNTKAFTPQFKNLDNALI